MGIVPVLFVIIVIASVAANYNKVAKQRLEDQRKRMQMRQNASNPPKTQEKAGFETRRSSIDVKLAEPIQKTCMPLNQKARPAVSVKNMQSAVIMAEIINKPVSIREK